MNIFTFGYSKVCFDRFDDLQFTPEPTCPRCGATDELMFTDYGQERIEDMMLKNQIKRCSP